MPKCKLSPSSKTALSLALERYENAKRGIERQRENELRLENERRERERLEWELRCEKFFQSAGRIVWSWPFLMLVGGICYYLRFDRYKAGETFTNILANVFAAGIAGAIGAFILCILFCFFVGPFVEGRTGAGKVFGVCFKIALVAVSLLIIFGR